PANFGEADFLSDYAAAARRRVPTMADRPMRKIMTAYVDMSDDGQPAVGLVAENLWVIAGFSGHGTMHGPIVAEVLAEMIAGTSDGRVDISTFDPLNRKAPPEWMSHGGTTTHGA